MFTPKLTIFVTPTESLPLVTTLVAIIGGIVFLVVVVVVIVLFKKKGRQYKGEVTGQEKVGQQYSEVGWERKGRARETKDNRRMGFRGMIREGEGS